MIISGRAIDMQMAVLNITSGVVPLQSKFWRRHCDCYSRPLVSDGQEPQEGGIQIADPMLIDELPVDDAGLYATGSLSTRQSATRGGRMCGRGVGVI